MRKVLAFFLTAVLCLSCIAPFGANAVVIETEETDLVTASDYPLQYWYVDPVEEGMILTPVIKIGKWTKSQLKVYVESQSTWTALSDSNIESYVRTAFSSWKMPGKSILFVNSASLADIEVYGITRAAATAKKYPESYAGYTEWGASTWQAAVYVNEGDVSENKRLYAMAHAVVYLIEDDELGNSTTKYKRLTTHEMGHAFGYYGHYEAGWVMKSDITTVTTYTAHTNEKNHLHQLY